MGGQRHPERGYEIWRSAGGHHISGFIAVGISNSDFVRGVNLAEHEGRGIPPNVPSPSGASVGIDKPDASTLAIGFTDSFMCTEGSRLAVLDKLTHFVVRICEHDLHAIGFPA